jgi:CO/xanthine dehydrogenase Mo-binding subunit
VDRDWGAMSPEVTEQDWMSKGKNRTEAKMRSPDLEARHEDIEDRRERSSATVYSSALPLKILNISRRHFLKAAAGSFVLAACSEKPKRVPGDGLKDDLKVFAGEGMPHGLRDDPKIFLAIAEDGTATFTCHRADMGQGIRTGLTLIVADELEADWSRMKVVQAPGDEEKYGNQSTDGSRTTRHHFMAMRRIGAAARTMLETAAARQWGVPVAEVKAINHEVVHTKSGRKTGYGALAKAASSLPVPAHLKLKDPTEFRYIGKGKTNIIDGVDITTGNPYAIAHANDRPFNNGIDPQGACNVGQRLVRRLE